MGLVDVQLTSHYKFSRPIPERGAKGLVRETPENLKVEQWTDLDRSPSQIRLAADHISCSSKNSLGGYTSHCESYRDCPLSK